MPKLTKSQYWEWRTTITELEKAKESVKLSHEVLKNLQKDVEIAELKAKLYGAVKIGQIKAYEQEAQQEYDRHKNKLEKALKINLSDCIIDGETFEVVKKEEL